MANYNIQDSANASSASNEINILAYDANKTYKIPLTKEGFAFLNDAAILIGKQGNIKTAEIFNNYSANQATAACSHAEGDNTVAASECQHVQGKNNLIDSQNKYAHIVGNGDAQKRSNAHTLDWSGNGWYAGSVEAQDFMVENKSVKTSIKELESRGKILYGEDEPSNDKGNIGDIYCFIIKE